MPNRIRRRPLEAAGDHTKGRHRAGGLGVAEDRNEVVGAPEASIEEAAERWTHVTLSYVGHTNNCKY
jgi:hypothetical protein